MKRKIISMVLALAMVVTSTAYASTNKDIKKRPKSQKVIIQEQINKVIEETQKESPVVDDAMEILLITDGRDVTKELKSVGANSINRMSTSVFLIKIPMNRALNISNIGGIKAAGKNRKITLPKPVNGIGNADLNYVPIDNPNLEYAHGVSGIAELWKKGYDGRDTKVAIIDSGVEPAHEMLTATSDGKIKIASYNDFWKAAGELGEGDVLLKEYRVTGNSVTINGKEIKLSKDCTGENILLGFFEESKAYLKESSTIEYHDVNNNGKSGKNGDKIPVLVVNYRDNNKGNDEIYVDTDMNNDFSNDKQMGIYNEAVKDIVDIPIFELKDDKLVLDKNGQPVVKDEYKASYDKLVNHFKDFKTGSNYQGTSFNFVISEVTSFDKNDGSEQWLVNLAYDGNGHGTHVAADATGNGYQEFSFVDKDAKDKYNNTTSDGTLKGSAPGAQVMACRVFQSHGSTGSATYLSACEYVAEKGVDVINMSLGHLPALNDQDPESIFLNMLSKKYGIVFCLSAGNDGPGINTVGAPSTTEWAITVGAYNAAWLNYEYPQVENCKWDFSSVGPTDDGRLKPNTICPGSMISAYPMWYTGSDAKIRGDIKPTVGHGLMQGTSQASPYMAGIVASLKQAINEEDLPFHPLVVKEAIFETGDKTINGSMYKPIEIGGGMINPIGAYEYLNSLKNRNLSNEDLKISDSYIDISEIELKSEVEYTEMLDYYPQGLNVRCGNIPEEVKVNVTNTKSLPVTVKLSKDAYSYKTDWFTLSESNLSLQPGETKSIKVSIDKTKLEQGVNSAIIRMEDPSTPLKEGIIPVTIVNYMDLSLNNPVVYEDEPRQFKVEDVVRHFVRIPEGAKRVEIKLERTDDSDESMLIPTFYDPTGICHQEYTYMGSNIIRLAEDYPVQVVVLKDPMPGTWEIDMLSSRYGLPDGETEINATGKHRITASLKGISFDPNVLVYEGKTGESSNAQISVLNLTDDKNTDVTFEAPGVYSEQTNLKVEKARPIMNKQLDYVDFNITEEDPNAIFRIKTRNITNDSDDIDLAFYKVVNGRKIEVASSGNSGSDEDIEIKNLPAGQYKLEINAFSTAPITNYDLIVQVVNYSNLMKGIEIDNPVRKLNKDANKLDLKIKLPDIPGMYEGNIIARDNKGQVLGIAKIEENVIAKNYNPIDVKVVKNMENLELGKNASITINVENKEYTNKNVMLLMALYDKETNKLIKYNSISHGMKGLSTADLKGMISIPNTGKYIIKCFVWDSLNTGKPLCPIIEKIVE